MPFNQTIQKFRTAGAESVTTSPPLLLAQAVPSAYDAGAMAKLGAKSSSEIVAVACSRPAPSVALTGPDRARVNVSPASKSVSPTTATGTLFAVSPGANASVPLVAV
jgi:hypothetical protein